MSFFYFDRSIPSSFTVRSDNDRDADERNDDESVSSRATNQSSAVDTEASLTDHEVITGFPPGYLHSIFRESHHNQDDRSFGGTILSSAPSGDDGLFPLVSAHTPDDVTSWSSTSPRPLLNTESALSISTTESEYRNLQSLENSVTSDANHGGTFAENISSNELSFSTLDLSSLPPSIVHSMDDESNENALVVHCAYRNIANRLARLPTRDGGGEWFSRFTEEDWVAFRVAADMVLQALEPCPSLALPPTVPHFNTDCVSSSASCSHDVSEYLPKAFFCSLCHDIIVGATTLSCACEKSTVCTACWESYSTCIVESCDSDLVQIEMRETCPSCQINVASTVSCHALDMAIFHAVKNVPTAIQHAYYFRLDQWRKEVLQRLGSTASATPSRRHDVILSELIQREEDMFWKKGDVNKNNAGWIRPQQALLFLGEVAMCMAISSLTAMGISVLARRR